MQKKKWKERNMLCLACFSLSAFDTCIFYALKMEM